MQFFHQDELKMNTEYYWPESVDFKYFQGHVWTKFKNYSKHSDDNKPNISN